MSADLHAEKIKRLQEQIKAQKGEDPISLRYGAGHSNTTRTKSYKKASSKIDFSALNEIVSIDPLHRIAIVEPRVTMEELVRATLPFGLVPPVIPEFKWITVGGAVMGGAGESSSHRFGLFNDACTAFEIISGDGVLLRASKENNADLFYGIAGSYGSLGALVSVEISLVEAKKFVHLRYHRFSQPLEAIAFLQKLMHSDSSTDFLDGIVFAKDHTVIIEGRMQGEEEVSHLHRVTLEPAYAEWYFQHAQRKDVVEEVMSQQEYLFRYDRGVFWMGAYLFHPAIFMRFIVQGIFGLWRRNESFSDEEMSQYSHVPQPNVILRTLFAPLMSSKKLWGLLHKAERWVKRRSIIQDFCLPENRAGQFLEDVLEEPGTFPLWLCPIKGTRHPQIFSPHLLKKRNPHEYFINVGIYGLPRHFSSIESITKNLEKKTWDLGGRKVLYSHSYYSPTEFWQIYSKEEYEALRMKTNARGVWHEITDKVLSE